ncbi:MAG: alpha/beta fold hydrolase [Pseudomonadales bacterium]
MKRVKKHGVLSQRGCLRRYNSGNNVNASERLVLFPWAGAGASAYRHFIDLLPNTIEVLVVQLPGREDLYRQPRLLTMNQIVSYLLDDLIALFDRPVSFFGHSMGALVAYECALALKKLIDLDPKALILSGCETPNSKNCAPYVRCLASASEETLMEDLRQMGGTHSAIMDSTEMMRTLLPVLRADYQVLDNYTSKVSPRLSCPLVIAGGKEDISITLESLADWKPLSAGEFHVYWFEGDHFYLCSDPQLLAVHIQTWIKMLTPSPISTELIA